jgi:hypothetical protein
MCERKLNLTKHHLYPKETHKIMCCILTIAPPPYKFHQSNSVFT